MSVMFLTELSAHDKIQTTQIHDRGLYLSCQLGHWSRSPVGEDLPYLGIDEGKHGWQDMNTSPQQMRNDAILPRH